MAILYIDPTSGNDTTGDGSLATPWKTLGKFRASATTNDELRVFSTGADTEVTTGDFVFTGGSVTITCTGGDVSASLPAGSYIGKTTATGNGAFETFYRVNTSVYTAGTGNTVLTLSNKYHGTSETVPSVMLKTYVQDASNDTNSSAMYINNQIFTVSGGWRNDVGSPVQDGETWLKVNGATARTTAWYAFRTAGTGIIYLSKMNFVESYSTHYNIANTSTTSYCTLYNYVAPFLGQNATTGSSAKLIYGDYISYSVIIWEASCTYGLITLTAGGTWTFNYCYFNSIGTVFYVNSNTGIVFFDLTNSIIISGANGISKIAGSTQTKFTLTGSIIKYCPNGMYLAGNNYEIVGGEFVSCTNGIYAISQGSVDILVNSCSFDSCSYGIKTARCYNSIVHSCSFTSCTYGFATEDQYGRNYSFYGCAFTTVGTYGIYVDATNFGTIISGCTIDTATVAKLFYNPSYGVYNIPKYIVSDCNVPNGQYFGTNALIESNVVYRTEAPALQLTFVGTVGIVQRHTKVWSTYVTSGQDYSVSCYIKAGATWAGSLQPVLKLNGKTIVTGATISTVTEDWVQYTYTTTGGLVTTNGELSLEFIVNANTIALYFDDFAIEVI